MNSVKLNAETGQWNPKKEDGSCKLQMLEDNKRFGKGDTLYNNGPDEWTHRSSFQPTVFSTSLLVITSFIPWQRGLKTLGLSNNKKIGINLTQTSDFWMFDICKYWYQLQHRIWIAQCPL